VCEDERRSRLRNEQLLREFDDLEVKARELGERTAEVSAVKVCVDVCLFCYAILDVCSQFIIISHVVYRMSCITCS